MQTVRLKPNIDNLQQLLAYLSHQKSDCQHRLEIQLLEIQKMFSCLHANCQQPVDHYYFGFESGHPTSF